MAPPVYSTQLLAQSFVGSGSASYAVPSGFRAIVRDIDVSVPANLTQGALLLISVGFGPAFFDQEFPSGWNGHLPWRGRQVINTGDTIELALDLGTNPDRVDVVISGYLLSTP